MAEEEAKNATSQEKETGEGNGSSVPVRVWLDVVQPGFGAKFSTAFEAAGLDVVADLYQFLNSKTGGLWIEKKSQSNQTCRCQG